jgi:hypothetical protein
MMVFSGGRSINAYFPSSPLLPTGLSHTLWPLPHRLRIPRNVVVGVDRLEEEDGGAGEEQQGAGDGEQGAGGGDAVAAVLARSGAGGGGGISVAAGVATVAASGTAAESSGGGLVVLEGARGVGSRAG